MRYIKTINRHGQRVIRVFGRMDNPLEVLNATPHPIVSAGCVGITAGGMPYTYGRIDVLGVDPDENDGALLRAMWRESMEPRQ